MHRVPSSEFQARAVLVSAVILFAALGMPNAARADYTFVSSPDSWNADIGDVRSAVGWDAGEPNSTNASWREALRTVLARLASHEPRFALVAGDLVNGHWHVDVDGVRTFGSTATVRDRRQAIREAAGTYYPQWRARFRRHGLRPRPAIGDHELGDNPWVQESKQALVRTFRMAWAKRFTSRNGGFAYRSHPPRGTQHARTAYAFRSGPVQLVTVDVFHQRPDGSVHAEVVGTQLTWLRRVLSRANDDPTIEFIVVQGHTPVLRPDRAVGSSQIRLEGGRESAFWRTLERQHVDLYLAGEFHAISRANAGGVEQLVHGSIIGFASFNYLSVNVSATQLDLTLHKAPVTRTTDARLWQVGWTRPQRERNVGSFRVVGTMTITAAGAEIDRTGYFAQ